MTPRKEDSFFECQTWEDEDEEETCSTSQKEEDIQNEEPNNDLKGLKRRTWARKGKPKEEDKGKLLQECRISEGSISQSSQATATKINKNSNQVIPKLQLGAATPQKMWYSESEISLNSKQSHSTVQIPPYNSESDCNSDKSDEDDEEETDSDDGLISDEITRLQAILADVLNYGFYSADRILCKCACLGLSARSKSIIKESPRTPGQIGISVFTCADVAQAALLESSAKYPDYAETLKRLAVEFAERDIAIFADHEDKRIYLTVRGTDPLRDISNDALALLGVSPSRIEFVKMAYLEVKQRFPNYTAYGCGHSVDSNIMHDLAATISTDKQLAFRRVDVFNAAGSQPLRENCLSLAKTRFYSHHVCGDLVGLFFKPPINQPFQDPSFSNLVKENHARQPSISQRRRPSISETVREKVMMIFDCVSPRRSHYQVK